MFTVSNERFDELVADALGSLPPELAKEIDNVAIIVEDEAEGRQLFGLFEGIPLTKRGPMSYTGALPIASPCTRVRSPGIATATKRCADRCARP